MQLITSGGGNSFLKTLLTFKSITALQHVIMPFYIAGDMFTKTNNENSSCTHQN